MTTENGNTTAQVQPPVAAAAAVVPEGVDTKKRKLDGEESKAPPPPERQLLIKRLSEKARLPTRGSAYAAGYDLYSAEKKVIPAKSKALIDTQISIAVPKGCYGRVAPRSGLASKFMIDTGAGVIDADYRGIVYVLLFNFSDTDFEVSEGDRIAQLIVEKIETPEVVEVNDLEETLRGAGGFGSTALQIQPPSPDPRSPLLPTCSMLLSPIASPSRFHASLCLPLPPLQHDILGADAQDQVVDEDSDSSASVSDSDSADAASESTRTSASDDDNDDEVELDVDVDDTLSKDITTVVLDYNIGIGHGVDATPFNSSDPLSTRACAGEEPAIPIPTSAPVDGYLQAGADEYPHAHARTDASAGANPLTLPVELIYTIVELAAAHRRTAVSLCRVSSWVRAAVLPILYGTLVLQGNGPLPFDHLSDASTDNEEVDSDVVVLEGDEREEEHAYDGDGDDDKRGLGRIFRNASGQRRRRRRLESPLAHVRSLWLDVPPERAPRSLDACPRLRQLALPLEAHATICNTQRWLACDPKNALTANTVNVNALQGDTSSCPNAILDVDEEYRSDLNMNLNSDLDLDLDLDTTPMPTTCCSFTVLGQSHPHRWAPLTSSPNGRAFLRGVTHLRILNLCLSHYIPLEYTPNLTHLCIPFFDLRISPSTLSSDLGGHGVGVGGVGDPLNPTDVASALTSSLTGSAATTSFTGLDYILSSPTLQMVVLTLNPRYWRFDELSLKGWAVRAMARDSRLYVVAETRDDATRDWEVPRRDWEEEAKAQTQTQTQIRDERQALTQAFTKRGEGKEGCGHCSVWEKAVLVRRKFLTRLSRSWETYSGSGSS